MRAIRSASVTPEDFLANSPGSPRATVPEGAHGSPAPLGSAESAMLRQQHRVAHRASVPCAAFPPTRPGRCVRLTCANPNCQRRAPVHPVPIARGRCIVRFTPSRRASVCRFRDGVELCRLSVTLAARLWRFVAARFTPFGARANGLDRFPRCLVTGGGFHDPKHLRLTSVLFDEPASRDRCFHRPPLLPFHHPNPREGLELDRPLAFSRNRTQTFRSERH